MKRIISLLISIIMIITLVPAVSADSVSQGEISATAKLSGTTGTVEINLVHPKDKDIKISALEMEVILPSGFSFGGDITTPLGAKWEIGQGSTYDAGGRSAKTIYVISSDNSAIPNESDYSVVAQIPVAFSANIAPGDKEVTVNLKDVAVVNHDGTFVSGKDDYFVSDTYNCIIKYYKSITGATITGIENVVYNGFNRTPIPTVVVDGTTLIEDTDYTVVYSNNIECGMATATIRAKGNYSGQVVKNYYIIPQLITGIKCSNPTTNSAKVSWRTSENADGYYIYRSTSQTSNYTLIKTVQGSSISSYTDTGLLSGTKYYYKVCAYMVVNGKKISGTLTSSAPACTTSGYTVNTPTGLAVSARTSTGITLKWNKTQVANNNVSNKKVTGYYLYRSTNKNSGYKRIADIKGGDTLTYKDLGLGAGKTYYYRLLAYRTYKGEVCSGGYTSTSATTLSKVGNVTGFTKSTVKISQINLVWNSVATANGYEIYFSSQSASGYTLLATASGTKYTHSGLKNATNYYYKIRAYRLEDGKKVYGSFTSALSVKTGGYKVAKPKNLKISSNTTKQIKIKWKKVSGANGYYIYRSTKKASGYKKVKTITKGSTVSFTNKKLKEGTTYYYRVVAYRTYKGEYCLSEYAQLTAGTKSKAPTISLKKASKTSVKVTAKKVKGAKGYQVYYSTKKSKGYKKLYTGTKKVYTKKSLKKGKKYYFKVRAYRVINGKKYYSSYSKVKSIKL